MAKTAIKIIFITFIVITVACNSNDNNVKHNITKNELIEYNNKLVRYDSAVIVAYSDTAGLNPQPTSSGLWITIHKQGNGSILKYGDIVNLKYKISTLLGKVYYSSDTDGIKKFTIGDADEPMGLSEALITMQKGTSATLILMPDKAFGLIGDENKIVGRQILRYDFEIIDL